MATESQLTISPRKRRAMASAKAVFPLAVGPSTTTTSGSRSNFGKLATFSNLGNFFGSFFGDFSGRSKGCTASSG